MDIVSSAAYWLLIIILQFGGIVDGEAGDSLIYEQYDFESNSKYEIFITLTDIPAPDYWIVEADIDEAGKNGTIDGRDHPGLKRTKGHIGFLGHGSHVEYRNIIIKELK